MSVCGHEDIKYGYLKRHPSPTVDDLIHSLNGATAFSKLDFKAGHNQIPLAGESHHITTCVTHKGLRHYARLNFGTNSASEIFQNIISKQLRDIWGTLNICDDIIVYDKTESRSWQSIEKCLRNSLMSNSLLTYQSVSSTSSPCPFLDLSFPKMEFHPSQQSPSNPWHDPSKVIIRHPQLSRNGNILCQVHSIIAVTYHTDSAIWWWTQQHQHSFEKIKEVLTSETMVYFDPLKETELTTDASPIGQSAILSQKHQEVMNVNCCLCSHSLFDAECWYSQTQKEHWLLIIYGR